MKKLSLVGAIGLIALAISGLVQAHHSHAMFDHSREVTLTGTVTNFAYTNPHAFLYIDVEGDDGGTVNYWIEMSNIPNMIRRGVSPKTFNAGDVVTVNIHPLMDGRPGGNYITITDAAGKTYD
jgi:hypothetical protein